MVKKYKIILSVLLVILVITAVVVVTGVIDINKAVNPEGSTHGNWATSTEYTDTFQVNTDCNLPLMRTDIENLFFTMDKKGDVRFYKVAGGAITEVPETGSFEVKATCSSQEIPALIHYIEEDGHTQGFGLFTTDIYENTVYIYKYAFFKVTDMFKGFDDGKGTLLMLLDVEMDRFYSEDKIYSEAFYLYADHTSKHFLSEDQRTVDTGARAKTDYKMFNDAILDQGDANNVLFFSSRYYVDYSMSGKADIFTSGGSGTNVDNVRYVTDIASLYFKRTDGVTYYFKNSEAGDSFSLQSFNGRESTSVAAFSGSLKDDYIIDNDVLFNRTTGAVFGITDAKSAEVVYTCFKSDFKADMFRVSQNERYCAIRGANTDNTAAVGIMDLDTGKMIAYTDEIFGYIADMQVLNDGSVVISVATNKDVNAASYYQLTAVIE